MTKTDENIIKKLLVKSRYYLNDVMGDGGGNKVRALKYLDIVIKYINTDQKALSLNRTKDNNKILQQFR